MIRKVLPSDQGHPIPHGEPAVLPFWLGKPLGSCSSSSPVFPWGFPAEYFSCYHVVDGHRMSPEGIKRNPPLVRASTEFEVLS